MHYPWSSATFYIRGEADGLIQAPPYQQHLAQYLSMPYARCLAY